MTRKIKIRNRTHNVLLIIFVLDKFDDNLLLWLNLKHLHDEAHEWSRFSAPSISASEVVKLHSFVYQCFICQPKTLFLPKWTLVYFRPSDLLYQILRVRAMNTLCRWICFVCHMHTLSINQKPWQFHKNLECHHNHKEIRNTSKLSINIIIFLTKYSASQSNA